MILRERPCGRKTGLAGRMASSCREGMTASVDYTRLAVHRSVGWNNIESNTMTCLHNTIHLCTQLSQL